VLGIANFIIEVVNQLLLIHLLLVRPSRKLFRLYYFFFKIFYLVFIPLNDFLTVMRPLSKLALHLLVVKQLLLKLLNSSSHLMCFIHKVLCLFGLILEFPSELVVLNDSKLCGANLILFIVEHVHLNGFNVQQHLLPKCLDFFNLFSSDCVLFQILFSFLLC